MTTVEAADQVQQMTDPGLRPLENPREALPVIITNTLLHRDHAHIDGAHIRIFENRIKAESAGRLPPTSCLKTS